MKKTAPYGTWRSALSGDYIASASLRLSEPCFYQGEYYWLEGRPSEQGRQTLVRYKADGLHEDLLDMPWHIRSKVHEYGGGPYCFGDNALFFCHSSDQQIHRLCLRSGVITAVSQQPQCRFADLHYDPQRNQLYAVREDHTEVGQEPHNALVRFAITADNPITTPEVIDATHDFVSTPRVSPCGHWLTYLTWDHPNMPWDNNQLWLCPLDKQGAMGGARCIAGNGNESLFQPQWSPSGHLFWVSDSSNWWNLRQVAANQLQSLWNNENAPLATQVFPQEAEYATPQWVFNMSTYGFLSADCILATFTHNGLWYLCELRCERGKWQQTLISTDLVYIANVQACAESNAAVFIGASATSPLAVYQYANGQIRQLSQQPESPLTSEDISQAQSFHFVSGTNETVHGFYYAPKNQQFQAPQNSAPPVIVIGHGGPTGATDASFNYKIQFWTQRGFAVVDVNYRGSTGFGRQYRHALQGEWGVADVLDLCAAVDYVTAQGWAHPQQKIIRGSSAGGYSVLAALTDTDSFNAGTTLYGIGDLETLATDTHKFEARYLDGLIGPYPAQQTLYVQRSPIHKVANIRCPLLVFQGEDDAVVPPNQAQQMVEAVKTHGLPVAYVLYQNEGHGFRQSTTIKHQLQAELYFYQQIFALENEDTTGFCIPISNWNGG